MVPSGSLLPPNLFPYVLSLPPVRPAAPNHEPLEARPSISPAHIKPRTKLYETQASLANSVENMSTLEVMFAGRDSVKRDFGLLQQLVKKTMSSRDHEREEKEFSGIGGAMPHLVFAFISLCSTFWDNKI